jgi:hypothetical protein
MVDAEKGLFFDSIDPTATWGCATKFFFTVAGRQQMPGGWLL